MHELQDRKEKMNEQRKTVGGRSRGRGDKMNIATEGTNDEHGRGQKCLAIGTENKREI